MRYFRTEIKVTDKIVVYNLKRSLSKCRKNLLKFVDTSINFINGSNISQPECSVHMTVNCSIHILDNTRTLSLRSSWMPVANTFHKLKESGLSVV